jgi:hypothetical protein
MTVVLSDRELAGEEACEGRYMLDRSSEIGTGRVAGRAREDRGGGVWVWWVSGGVRSLACRASVSLRVWRRASTLAGEYFGACC